MKNFFNNILDLLFKPKTNTFSTGALESPVDTRNIALSSFQAPVSLPVRYVTEMPPVEDQGLKPKCTGSSVHKIKELFLMRENKYVDLSDDDLYEQGKLIDGIPDVPGTYLPIVAKVACTTGISSKTAYDTRDSKIIAESRLKHKLGGYAFVANNYDAICNAIYRNNAIVASLAVDLNWFKGIMTKFMQSYGRHAIVLHGFDYTKASLIGQNSWGVGWVGYIAGVFDSRVVPGHFEIKYSEIKDLADIITFTDIPKEILDDVKNTDYQFVNVLRMGAEGYEVKKLQERLNKEGFNCGVADGRFGPKTKIALMAYQNINKIMDTGILDATTRNTLNGKKSKIDNFCVAIRQHEGWYAGSRSYRNNNPGNLKYIGQTGTTGKDKGGFAIFKTYDDGYNALKNMIVRACTTGSKYYSPDMSILKFFSVYAPSNDNNDPNAYARFVAKEIGVSVDTKMRELL